MKLIGNRSFRVCRPLLKEFGKEAFVRFKAGPVGRFRLHFDFSEGGDRIWRPVRKPLTMGIHQVREVVLLDLEVGSDSGVDLEVSCPGYDGWDVGAGA